MDGHCVNEDFAKSLCLFSPEVLFVRDKPEGFAAGNPLRELVVQFVELIIFLPLRLFIMTLVVVVGVVGVFLIKQSLLGLNLFIFLFSEYPHIFTL